MAENVTPQTPEDTSRTQRLNLQSDARLRRRFMVTDQHVKANVRVGLMLEILDKLAEETALQYVRQYDPDAHVVTAAMDDLEVRSAPDIEQDVIFHARINFVGRSSLEVGVRIEQDGPAHRHIASCYFTMVARRADQSVRVEPLAYTSDIAQQRAARAQKRRADRGQSTDAQPTVEEYAMLHGLHRELENPTAPHLLAKDLVTSGWERTYPEQENVPQTIFGGYVIHHAYMYAHICAEMIADQRALLVNSKRIEFHQPVRMGDKLHFVSQVTYTGRTSLTVETSITRISRDRSMTALSNNCVFTFVNVDADLKLVPVPRVFPATYAEDIRYLTAYRRHRLHAQQGG